MLTVLAIEEHLRTEKKNRLRILPYSSYHPTSVPSLATVSGRAVLNPTMHQPVHKCIFTPGEPHRRPDWLLLLMHPVRIICMNLGFPSRAVPSRFQWVCAFSRVWVNIIMCDLRFRFSKETHSWKFLYKEIEKLRAGCKNVRTHRSKCVKWELPTGFLLSLVIYSTYHQNWD